MLRLEDFGAALRTEREKASYSLANFARSTAGISKDDIRDFEAGKKAPDKLTLKKLFHCFPILMQFEDDLRHGNYEAPSEVRQTKPKRHAPRAPEPTRLPPPPPKKLHYALSPDLRVVPKLEIVRQHELPPEPLAQPLAVPLARALRKTRTEMLTELAQLAKKRLGNLTSEEFDFTIKNDGKALVVKLQVSEGKLDEGGDLELVDSGCYLTVSPREPGGLRVFCRTMTNGDYCAARGGGVTELLSIARMLHEQVKDRRFDA